MSQQFNYYENRDESQQNSSSQPQPYCKPQRRSQSDQDRADQIGKKWGVDRRTVYRCAEYYTAVTALAQIFGGDILFCILNRQVRLNHRAVVNLSKAAQGRYAFVFAELGDAIRNGDSKLLNRYVKIARNLQ